MRSKVISIIMGGGRGTRLNPLTKLRSKPAVPLGGKYRLVDIPISNCLNSGLNNIFILTQFNTASLHRHIQDSYKFDPFGGGFVDILSAEQTERGDTWYQGTADAVRQNLMHINIRDEDLVLILSGDQLYSMDFQDLIRHHQKTQADVTIAGTAMEKSGVSDFGLMRIDEDYSIIEFVEKPRDPEVIESLRIPETLMKAFDTEQDKDYCLVNMGIYIFKGKTLIEALNSEEVDFGKEIIPGLLGKGKLVSYIFNDYWEDIGTIAAFFEANLRLSDPVPPFNFFNENWRIYTNARYLPAAKVNQMNATRVILGDGVIIDRCTLERCVIGVRSVLREGSEFHEVVLMGSDSYETPQEQENNRKEGRPHIGVGKNCRIRKTIIDKNVRIGNNVVLDPEGKPDFWESGGVIVRDGILIVIKESVIPDGTMISPDRKG